MADNIQEAIEQASKKYKPTSTYDFTKEIKNITLNPFFIKNLEAILMYFTLNVFDDPRRLPVLFEVFDKMIAGEKLEKDPNLTNIEKMVFTLYHLQQILKYHAEDQGLVIESTQEFTAEEIKAALTEMMDSSKPENAQALSDLIKDKLS